VSARNDRWLATGAAAADLKARSVQGGALTLLAQGGKFALTFGSTAILARLLAPEAFGLIAMVSAVTGFVLVIKDLGLSTATVQRATVSHEQVSALFWINAAVSLALALLTAAAAPLVALFYGEPSLAPITAALAASFVFGGFTQQHQALLRRQMRFGRLAAVELGSLAAGIAAAIAAAAAGWGVWALVVREVAAAIALLAGTLLACDWRPAPPRRTAGLREMVRFGGNLTGFNLVNYLARNLDNVLIGRFVGPGPLGAYSRAYNLLMQPLVQINQPLGAVAVPLLSRLAGDPAAYRAAWRRVAEAIAIVTVPGVAWMIASADWIVAVVLGPGWEEAGRLFALLGVAGLVQPICNTTGWLLVSQGRGEELFRWGIVGSALAIGSFVAGLPWGAAGVAAAYAAVFLLVQAPLLFWWVGRSGPVGTLDFYRVLGAPACAALGAGASVLLYRRAFAPTPLEGLLVSLPVAAGMALLVLVLLPSGREALAGTVRAAALLRRREAPAAGKAA